MGVTGEDGGDHGAAVHEGPDDGRRGFNVEGLHCVDVLGAETDVFDPHEKKQKYGHGGADIRGVLGLRNILQMV